MFGFYSLFSNTIDDISGHSASENIHYSKKKIGRCDPSCTDLNLLAPKGQLCVAACGQQVVVDGSSMQLKLQGKATKM